MSKPLAYLSWLRGSGSVHCATWVLAAVRAPSRIKDRTVFGYCFSPLPHSLAQPTGPKTTPSRIQSGGSSWVMTPGR